MTARAKILVVDDEPLALERLRMGVERIADVELVGAASDAFKARELIRRLAPDVVILDIAMPGMSGIELARTLSNDGLPSVVFVSAYDNYGPATYDVDASDYVVKPVDFGRLEKAVRRALFRRLNESQAVRSLALERRLSELESAVDAQTSPFDDHIWVPSRNSVVRVTISTLLWIEAAGDYALFHGPERSMLHRVTMAELERRLNPVHMMRVHRSAFVNPGHVSSVERLRPGAVHIRLSNERLIAVGPKYVRDVMRGIVGDD